MTCFAINRNSARALILILAVDISDESRKPSVLVVHQNHSPLGIGNINVVFPIYCDSRRRLESATLSAKNTERAFSLRVQYVYGRNARIADDDPILGVGGQVLRRSQHSCPAVNEGNNGIASINREGMRRRQSHRVCRWRNIVYESHAGRKHPRRDVALSCVLLRCTFGACHL